MFSNKIEKAIRWAARLHKNQLRKDGKTPYVSHCYSVACILSNYTNEQNLIVAGLLHDVLEDVPGFFYEDLVREFGESVAKLVLSLSENKDPNEKTDKKITWEDRKSQHLVSLRNAKSEVLVICVADKIHNLRSTINELEETGEKTWENFNAPLEKQIWYQNEILKIMKDRIPLHPITRELEMAICSFQDAVRQSR